jgi:Zn-dependent protease with chaperone function
VKDVMLLGVALCSAAVTFGANWLALIPWRRARGQHWTEQARWFWPVRVAAAGNLWVVPAVVTLSCTLLWPHDSPHWAFLVLASAIGAAAGTIPLSAEVFPRISRRELLRETARAWTIRFVMWLVFLLAIALMPEQFNVWTPAIAGTVIGLCILWTHGGLLWLGRKLGWLVVPTERLARVVKATSEKMGTPFKELWLMRNSLAQAYALPGSRTLLFSTRLLEILSEEEIAAVCAHELGHLSERWTDRYGRRVLWLTFLPWLFFHPMVKNFEMMGFMLLLIPTVAAPFIFRALSHRLELRADSVAKSNEADPGVYARALQRLYEDGLLPAVNAQMQTAHPHLYDRLMAAGVTPAFPRPQAPARTAWPGWLFSSALGLLAVLSILRLTGQL